MLRAGLITAMVGLAVTIGLYPLGFILPSIITTAPFRLGPWLLPGLIPLGVGIALIISYYLEQSIVSTDQEKEQQQNENVSSLEKHLERRQKGLRDTDLGI